ncbi:hypothetical protein AB0I98_48340 [Streptomyces sp. NPDC050211]|uniref:hypothetical protein n=1 Tax=Streptomyces sp. NPDC050211 TaxID=3154932 RepID=UPI0034217E61
METRREAAVYDELRDVLADGFLERLRWRAEPVKEPTHFPWPLQRLTGDCRDPGADHGDDRGSRAP